MKKYFLIISLFFCLAAGAQDAPAGAKITIVLPSNSQPRTKFGAARLASALGKAGYRVWTHEEITPPPGGRSIFISEAASVPPAGSATSGKKPPSAREGFSISSTPSGNIRITGADASGALYGCLELADRIRASGRLPTTVSFKDQPEMALRGACIGLQKSTLLPGRGPYEYPYTPENFPWFYDKALWVKYLDSMVDNRLNTLYLWNGHPFASLVRLPDYPYAVEVDEETFKKNEAIYRFLTEEAGKRGIWVIQLFYNIIVSKPFAEKNHIKTQDRNRHILPLIADYTRKSIAAFVEKYPNVGLMVTLGEAMEGVGQDDIDWFTQTIIPGIKEGLKALGRTDEPPVVLRAHDTDGPAVMKAALPLYKNLYVEAKYNGEALTTYTPHGPWADLHRQLSQISKGLIENVHIMANLEPFRYGSADFIQKCVQAMHSVYGASGLHLYPQASYWDWPYSADNIGATDPRATPNTDPRLLEMDRDWIWYKEWSRYAWNCHRDRNEEVIYWSRQLAEKFGCDQEHGKDILDAYEQSGEIAPKLLRRFGITDGNRQTLTLGMLMTQLIDPERFGLFTLLYESEGPPGEMLSQYAEKEWRHQPHAGETPVDVIRDVREEGRLAVEAIEKAAASVTTNREEFARLRNDLYCYKALADCYAAKAEAALSVLRYKYSGDPGDLEKALPLLQSSLAAFGELTRLAGPAYRYANSMQTQQRKIPIRGAGGKFITWQELMPVYENEVQRFRTHLDSLRTIAKDRAATDGATTAQTIPASTLPPLSFTNSTVSISNSIDGYFTLDSGARVFADTDLMIRAVAAPLKGLQTIRESLVQQKITGTLLQFANTESVDLLIGFFNQKGSGYLPPPQLETDASANDYGQAEPKITNAVVIGGMPSVNIHAWSFPPGEHKLELGKGVCLVIGFVKAGGKMRAYDAGLNDPGKKDLDWLFE